MYTSSLEGINLKQIRQKITQFVEKGTLDKQVIDTLLYQDSFVPKECELWDYKREAKDDKPALAETVLQIVSFYNTYGGYILYGVDEIIDNKEFVPCGVMKDSLNIKQIQQSVVNYTCDQIDVSYIEVEYNIGGNDFVFGLLHVPKRPKIKAPVFLERTVLKRDLESWYFQKIKRILEALTNAYTLRKKRNINYYLVIEKINFSGSLNLLRKRLRVTD